MNKYKYIYIYTTISMYISIYSWKECIHVFSGYQWLPLTKHGVTCAMTGLQDPRIHEKHTTLGAVRN